MVKSKNELYGPAPLSLSLKTFKARAIVEDFAIFFFDISASPTLSIILFCAAPLEAAS